MDYFVILVTMSCLVFGLLFFVDSFPPGTKDLFEWIAFIVLILSTIIVIAMILWDARTRKRHDQKKQRMLQKFRNKDKERDDERLKILFDLHSLDVSYHEHDNIFGNIEVPWKVEYDYKPLNFKTDSESPEDSYTHMNQIFADLLSKERFKKNIFSFEKKGIQTGRAVIKKFAKKSKGKSFVERDFNQSIDKAEIKKIKKEVKQKLKENLLTTPTINRFRSLVIENDDNDVFEKINPKSTVKVVEKRNVELKKPIHKSIKE